MSNVYNFYFGSNEQQLCVKENQKLLLKEDVVDVSQLFGEIEELKNEVMAEKEKTRQAIEELQNFRYEVYAELTALVLSHSGKLKLNSQLFEFVLTNPDKVSLEFVPVNDGKEYIAKMAEIGEDNAN